MAESVSAGINHSRELHHVSNVKELFADPLGRLRPSMGEFPRRLISGPHGWRDGLIIQRVLSSTGLLIFLCLGIAWLVKAGIAKAIQVWLQQTIAGNVLGGKWLIETALPFMINWFVGWFFSLIFLFGKWADAVCGIFVAGSAWKSIVDILLMIVFGISLIMQIFLMTYVLRPLCELLRRALSWLR